MTEALACPKCGDRLPDDAPEGLCPKCLIQIGLESGNELDVAAEGPATSPFQAAFTAPSPAELAPHFPQLEILQLLGQGGMGAVYKARQLKLDRFVALKILPPVAGRDPAFAERFTREARALARLSHPHIVGVHDFGEVDGLFFFVMEFVDGVNLRQLLQAGHLEPQQALKLVPQVCDALQYAHDEGIIHRDIKPENILLDKKGRVKIADFGLAKLLGRTPTEFTLTGTHQVMGTPHYMAPEQMEKPHTVDHRADIYSLGVVFYEMLTGELPLGRFAPPSEKAPVDVRLDDVVMRALAKEPERRYQRVSEVKTDLDALASGHERKPQQLVAPADRRQLEAVRRRVEAPAITLLLIGIMNCVMSVIGVAIASDGGPGPPLLLLLPATLGASILMVVGAVKMKNLESYGLAQVSSCLAFAPTPWFFMTVPVGIWALMVLRKPEVKAAFGLEPPLDQAEQWRPAYPAALERQPTPPEPEDRFQRKVKSMWDAARSLFVGSVAREESSAAETIPPARIEPREPLPLSPRQSGLSPAAPWGESPPPAAPPTDRREITMDRDRIRRELSAPAAGLLIASLIGPVIWTIIWLAIVIDKGPEEIFEDAAGYFAMSLLSAAVSVLFFAGTLRMRWLEGYELALFVSVLAMFPVTTFGYVVSLPMGVWAFLLLRKPEVRAAFGRRLPEPPAPFVPPETLVRLVRRGATAMSIVGVLAMLLALAIAGYCLWALGTNNYGSNDDLEGMLLAWQLPALPLAGLVIFAARMMKQFRWRWLALLASFLAAFALEPSVDCGFAGRPVGLVRPTATRGTCGLRARRADSGASRHGAGHGPPQAPFLGGSGAGTVRWLGGG